MVYIYNVHNDLKDKISNLNNLLQEKYKGIFSQDRGFLRNFIREYIGPIKSMEKLDNKHLALYEAKGGIVGVDGSTNRVGGTYPHFVEVFQGLAKSTLIKDEPIYKADIYSPLFSNLPKTSWKKTKRWKRKEKLKTGCYPT